ncbi:hypothetical protein [uncultured Deinococcus sp.]|uniref:hypothetical protein n=1 Tax=uncultured Deinococcus sp. TaxID=158789 RepID=UPI0037487284
MKHFPKIHTIEISGRLSDAVDPSRRSIWALDTNILRRFLVSKEVAESDNELIQICRRINLDGGVAFLSCAVAEYSTDSYSFSLNYERVLECERRVRNKIITIQIDDYNDRLISPYRLEVYARFLKVSEIILIHGTGKGTLVKNFDRYISWLEEFNLKIYSHLHKAVLEIMSDSGQYNSLIKAKRKDYISSCRSTAHDFNFLHTTHHVMVQYGMEYGGIPRTFLITEENALKLLSEKYYSPVKFFDPESSRIYLSNTEVECPDVPEKDWIELDKIMSRVDNIDKMTQRFGRSDSNINEIVSHLENSVRSKQK